MAEVRVFYSHVEVYPYVKGQCPHIENMMSKYDANIFSYIPIGYFIQNDILYLPRGISSTILEKEFNTQITPVTDCDPYNKIKKGAALFKPKTKIQADAIDFLCGENSYGYTVNYSQLGLNLDTGDGKTYSALTAILKLKLKAIIITHKERLKTQWIESLETMTSFPIENCINISGTEVMENIMKGKISGEIYCVNHQTISAYARVHGWTSIRDFFKKIKVGIKVIDEAHKFFESSLMIDYFSNVYKNIYLTATFGRNDTKELSIYKKAYASLARYGEETFESEEKRKHIHTIFCFFESHPAYGYRPRVKTGYGFSDYMYIDYELGEENHSLLKVVYKILDKVLTLEGKILIISPKIESADIIANLVKDYTGEDVGIVHSKNGKNNKEEMEKKIISSTIKSIGEGDDIKGLRVLINLTPIGSKGLADQLRGRLREYAPDKDTYLFYPIDMAVPETYEYMKRILPMMKKKCKSIMNMRMGV